MKSFRGIFSAIVVFVITGFFPGAVRAEPITAERDISYVKSASNPKQKLDVYYVKSGKNRPVIMFIHGGGWAIGDKSHYMRVGNTFAGKGFVSVVINYRLSPEVVHPAHIQDTAAAFAWVHKNITKYGGNPDKIFVSGHSAGGHLTALLVMDPRYLKAHSLSPSDITAVIPMSGIYDLGDPERRHLTFKGSFGSMKETAFGTTRATWKEASPITYVRRDITPMLIVYGENENMGIKTQANRFHEALKKVQAPVKMATIPGAVHSTVVKNIGGSDDRTTGVVLEFIRQFLK